MRTFLPVLSVSMVLMVMAGAGAAQLSSTTWKVTIGGESPDHAIQAQELAVLLYNGLPDRADFADEWRSIDPSVFTQAARAGASSSPSARG